MFLPIGDRPNLPQTPWMTWALIAANILIHLVLWPLSLQPADLDDATTVEYLEILHQERRIPVQTLVNATSRGDVVRYSWGSKPAQLSLPTLFTSMFLHGGLMHLAGNMLFLWIFGDNIEHRMGRWLFLTAYLTTGVAAALGDTVLRLGSSVPSVGASGAISGVLGLYFLWFPRNRVRVFVFLFPFIMQVIELPARWVLGMYLVLDNVLPLLVSGGAGGISYGAHIGGFVAGVVVAWGFTRQWNQPGSQSTTASPQANTAPPILDDLPATLRQLLAEQRVDDASQLFFQLPRATTRQAVPAADKLLLAETLATAGQARPALAVLQRLLSEHPQGRARVRAHLGAAQLLLYAFASPTAAYQHLYSALEENPSDDEATMARQLLQDLEARTKGMPRRPGG